MKNVLAIVCLLLLVGVGLWLALRETGTGPVDDTPIDVDEAPEFVPEGTMSAEGAELHGRGPRDGVRGAKRYPPGKNPYKKREVRMGSVEVLPVGPDGKVIPADDLTVRVISSYDGRFPQCKDRNRETGLWTFPEVPIGRFRVIVFGDLIADHEEGGLVREGVTTYVKASVQRGAKIHYSARLIDDTVPEKITLRLIGRQGRPAKVRYQVRERGMRTSVQHAKEIEQAYVGEIFAIPPGQYRLVAEVATGESAEIPLTLAPGEERDVELVLRR